MINIKQALAKLSLLPKPFLFLGTIIIIVILISISTLFLKSSSPQVVKTTPSNEEQNVPLSLSQISITFNKPLKSIDEVYIDLFPLVKFSSQLSKDKKTLFLSLNQKLLEDTQYIVEVQNKRKRPIYSWNFKTLKLANQGFGTPNISQEIENKDQKDYPLLHYIPFENDLFVIDYLSPLHLEVKLKTASPSAAMPLVEQWIQQRAVDPATHQVTFISE